MATCVLCNEQINDEYMYDHLEAEHPEIYEGGERWPDGELVIMEDWDKFWTPDDTILPND